jgi:integrase
VKRLKLPAAGHGKARALPRASVVTLLQNRARGCAPEAVNHYVRAVRGFFRWMVRAKRLGSNPLESLSLVNAAVEVRRARRELTADELRRLFDATRASARSYRGLSAGDRYYLYLVAAGTGFRATALANLTPDAFDLEAATPVVTLPARFNTSRKLKVQPLPAEVAAALGEYLTGRPAGVPVWGGTWAHADFHALRHSYLTLGGRSGIDLRTLQEIAGHSKPELTARYSHRRMYDLAGAVGKLPNLVPSSGPDAAETPLRLTGTDSATGGLGVPPGVPTG